MFVGSINNINTGTSSFERIMTRGSLYVDKSLFIEHFLTSGPDVQLIARQRRMGKSLNMDMLRCFLTDGHDYRPLFENLLVRESHVWEMANSAPVFLLNFKGLSNEIYASDVKEMLLGCMGPYLGMLNPGDMVLGRFDAWDKGRLSAGYGILLLTQVAHAATGKRPYVLIDEYDKMLMDNINSGEYDGMLKFMTNLFMNGLKDNPYLEKALLTGVTRISYEGLLSDLNNLTTFDIFMDDTYAEDYGITENEAGELSKAAGFNLDEARHWYNGIKIGGKPIYNIYGMMNMIARKSFKCYWGASGTMGVIAEIMGPGQRRAILNMLGTGETAKVSIEERISPRHLRKNCSDSMFYSLLVQAGYLSLEEMGGTAGTVAIPNVELREVWQRFLLSNFFKADGAMDPLFLHMSDPATFAMDVERYLSQMLDTMSYHDLPKTKYKDGKLRVLEWNYHMLLHMLLTAGKDIFQYRSIRSNRESGDGRYDILVEFEDAAVIFELKSAADGEDMATLAEGALGQIREMRYGAGVGKPITAVGCAFRKKTCRAVGAEIVY